MSKECFNKVKRQERLAKHKPMHKTHMQSKRIQQQQPYLGEPVPER